MKVLPVSMFIRKYGLSLNACISAIISGLVVK